MAQKLVELAKELKVVGTTAGIIKAAEAKMEELKIDSSSIDEWKDVAAFDKAMIEAYKVLSIEGFTNLLTNGAASKLALKKLSYVGKDLEQEEIEMLEEWEIDSMFLLTRYEVEKDIYVNGSDFLGWKPNSEGIPKPFFSEIINYETSLYDPSEINVIEYIIGSIKNSDISYQVREKYILITDEENQNYGQYEWTVDYAIEDNQELTEEQEELAREFKAKMDQSEIREEIRGVVMLNNLNAKGDLDIVVQYMKDAGEMTYIAKATHKDLSPKVINKDQITKKQDSDVQIAMRHNRVVSFSSKEANFQQPLAIFQPTQITEQTTRLIKFFEELIYMFSLASKPTGASKKAQEGQLEVSLNNETPNNYTEYKKNIREHALTKFMRQIAAELGIISKFRVVVELSTQQERLIKGDEKFNNEDNDLNQIDTKPSKLKKLFGKK